MACRDRPKGRSAASQVFSDPLRLQESKMGLAGVEPATSPLSVDWEVSRNWPKRRWFLIVYRVSAVFQAFVFLGSLSHFLGVSKSARGSQGSQEERRTWDLTPNSIRVLGTVLVGGLAPLGSLPGQALRSQLVFRLIVQEPGGLRYLVASEVPSPSTHGPSQRPIRAFERSR
jgi:hypothetical protein